MNHYVYLLEFQNGKKYVGMSKTHLDPELDACYLGSGGNLPKDRTYLNTKKTILGVYKNREEALQKEISEIRSRNAVKSDEYLNMRESCHERYGSKLTEEHKKQISERQLGRKRPEYKGKYLKGSRTPAQQANDLRMSIEFRGIKNPDKGLSGIENNGFKSWYYITPEGEYVEVHDKTKQELASYFGLTYRQLVNAFHYTNEHKKARTKPRKGWTFGNLPRPTDVGEA